MSNTYSISVETGGYRQLDLFAERCGEGNAVVTVADGNGVAIAAHTMPIAERRHHFSIAVPQKSTVTVAANGWLYASATFPNAMTCLTTAFAT